MRKFLLFRLMSWNEIDFLWSLSSPTFSLSFLAWDQNWEQLTCWVVMLSLAHKESSFLYFLVIRCSDQKGLSKGSRVCMVLPFLKLSCVVAILLAEICCRKQVPHRCIIPRFIFIRACFVGRPLYLRWISQFWDHFPAEYESIFFNSKVNCLIPFDPKWILKSVATPWIMLWNILWKCSWSLSKHFHQEMT